MNQRVANYLMARNGANNSILIEAVVQTIGRLRRTLSVSGDSAGCVTAGDGHAG